VLGTGWAMSTTVPDGSEKEEAAWELIKWLTGREITEFRIENGGIASPVRTDVDYSRLALEPLQIAVGNLINEFDISTSVIDSVFHSDVFNPLNDGLAEIAMMTKSPQQVGAEMQRIFDNWKLRQ
jgi:raffinose/stachyose/melibiose transport system substrate-binding protein